MALNEQPGPRLRVFEPEEPRPEIEELTLPPAPLERRVRAVIEKVRLRFLSPDAAAREIVELFEQEDREG